MLEKLCPEKGLEHETRGWFNEEEFFGPLQGTPKRFGGQGEMTIHLVNQRIEILMDSQYGEVHQKLVGQGA